MFKQTTAYELRISDRSSYLCSSDLDHRARRGDIAAAAGTASAGLQAAEREGCARRECSAALLDGSRRASAAACRPADCLQLRRPPFGDGLHYRGALLRGSAGIGERQARCGTEERRLGTGGVSTLRSRWWA